MSFSSILRSSQLSPRVWILLLSLLANRISVVFPNFQLEDERLNFKHYVCIGSEGKIYNWFRSILRERPEISICIQGQTAYHWVYQSWHSSRPLLRATYEVILLQPSNRYIKLSSHMGIEPQSFRLRAVYATPRPER